MTLEEIKTRKDNLNHELRKLEEQEAELRNQYNKEKFLGKFFIKKTEKLAMHVIEVHNGTDLFGEGVRTKGDGVLVGRFTIKAPVNPIFCTKEEFMDFIKKTASEEIIMNDAYIRY